MKKVNLYLTNTYDSLRIVGIDPFITTRDFTDGAADINYMLWSDPISVDIPDEAEISDDENYHAYIIIDGRALEIIVSHNKLFYIDTRCGQIVPLSYKVI